jgi:hypothetical protein
VCAIAAVLAVAMTGGVAGQTPAAQSSGEARAARYMEAVRNDPPQLMLFLRDMPKGADLHYHMSGGVYAENFIKWAAQDNLCVDTLSSRLSGPPCDSTLNRVPAASALQNARLYNQMIDALSMRNWNAARKNGHDQFFDTFGKYGAASGPGRTVDIMKEVTARAKANHVEYMELMWTPDEGGASRLGRSIGWGDGDFGRQRERLLAAGLRDTVTRTSRLIDNVLTQAKAPIEVRIMYQVSRATAPEQVFAQILFGFELASADRHVVGLNLVQPEDNYVAMRDFSLQMRMIQFLRALYPNVPVSLHAGELAPGLVPPEGLRFHINESVRVAGASRIGHGVDIAHEDSAVALLKEMARRKVMVEINLTSNAVILGVSGKDHPLHLYMKYGVPVALSTDDEGVARSDINFEYKRAVEEQGLTYPQLKQMAMNSIRYSFADAATKDRLIGNLRRDFAAFEAQIGR